MKNIIGLVVGLSLFVPLVSFADTTPVDTGGGNLIFCSGPLAPGYNVSLPGGGCGVQSRYVPYGQSVGIDFGGIGQVCQFWQGCMVK